MCRQKRTAELRSAAELLPPNRVRRYLSLTVLRGFFKMISAFRLQCIDDPLARHGIIFPRIINHPIRLKAVPDRLRRDTHVDNKSTGGKSLIGIRLGFQAETDQQCQEGHDRKKRLVRNRKAGRQVEIFPLLKEFLNHFEFLV